MIENYPIVEDTRRVRHQISAKFDHDIRRYIVYLQSEAIRREKNEKYCQPKRNFDTSNRKPTSETRRLIETL